MNLDLVTQNELSNFKHEIKKELQLLLNKTSKQTHWLKSSDVRALLNISNGTLETLRSTGAIPHTKLGGTYFYSRVDIEKTLENNKNRSI